VEDNWVVANTTGIYLDGTPRSAHQPVLFSGNVFALNDVAMRFHGVREALTFSNNEFRQNTVVADIEGGGDALGTTFIHNYFSDYVGYDLDNNGIGDVAYQVKRLSGELLDEHPQLEFFQGTVAIGLIDAIANAVPVFASKLLLIDREPSVNLAQNP
jgi:nitrous oxidase accessory protein